MDILTLGVLDSLKLLREKKISSVELTEEFINRINNDKNNVFITKTFDLARIKAKESDARYKNGQNKKLDGIVVTIKDVFCTHNIRTTCASKMLSNFVPSYESTVTQKLWNEGGIMIGKANMDEFSMGSSGATSFFGPTNNILRDKTRPDKILVPGGSSSGSAVAVQGDYCHVALGGDTGGSVKQPASFCDIVGVRPTYGRNSRHGLISFASSLDQAGILAKNVSDAAYILEIISGFDENDGTTLNIKPLEILQYLENINLSGMTLGIPKQVKTSDLRTSIQNVWNKVARFFEKKGVKIVEISIPEMENGVEVYYTIAPAEAFSNLARYDGIKFGYRTKNFTDLKELYENTRAEGFGSEVKRRILTGAYVLSNEHYNDTYLRATKVRGIIKKNFNLAFEKVDILLMPSAPNVAFSIDDDIDPITMYLNDIFTIPSNLAGLAGMSIPSGYDDLTGLPIGMQLIPKVFDEVTMFKFAKVLENGIKNGEVL